jgi:hypothetical protein
LTNRGNSHLFFLYANSPISIRSRIKLADLAPDLDLRGYAMRQTGNKLAKLDMAEVAISVRPELLIRVEGKGQSQSSGAIKLCFAKGSALSNEAANYVGTMLREFTSRFVPPLKTAIPRDCIVIDVFAERVHVAPRATKRRLNELLDACSEIAAMWDSIPEPKERTKYRTLGSRSDGKIGRGVRTN